MNKIPKDFVTAKERLNFDKKKHHNKQIIIDAGLYFLAFSVLAFSIFVYISGGK